MPLPKGMKIVPKKGESRAQAKARLEAKYADQPQSSGSGRMKGETAARYAAPNAGLEAPQPEGRTPKLRSNPGAQPKEVGKSGTLTRGSAKESPASKLMSQYAEQPFYPIERAFEGQPERTVGLPTGQVLQTPYGRDPFRTEMVEVCVYEETNFNWTTFTDGAANTDPEAAIVAARVSQIFEELVNIVNYNGRFTPIEALTAAIDWPTYLNNYSTCFGLIYTALSVLKGLDINPSMRTFATGVSGVNGNLDRIILSWRRLQKIPIPPKFVQMLSRIVGVFYDEPDQLVYLGYVNTGASTTTVTDWTSSSGAGSVGTLVNLMESLLTTLETGGPETTTIAMILSMVYGVPAPLPEPEIHTSGIAWDYWYTQCSQFLVTTIFETPMLTLADPSGVIPLLIRRDEEPEMETFTYLRPGLYGFGPVGSLGAAAKVTGLMTQNSAAQGFSRIYTTGTGNNTIVTENSFAALNFGNGSFFDVLWWSPFTASTSGTVGWQADTRTYDRWDEFYVNAQLLGSNTIKVLDEIFLTDLAIRTL